MNTKTSGKGKGGGGEGLLLSAGGVSMGEVSGRRLTDDRERERPLGRRGERFLILKDREPLGRWIEGMFQ